MEMVCFEICRKDSDLRREDAWKKYIIYDPMVESEKKNTPKNKSKKMVAKKIIKTYFPHDDFIVIYYGRTWTIALKTLQMLFSESIWHRMVFTYLSNLWDTAKLKKTTHQNVFGFIAIKAVFVSAAGFMSLLSASLRYACMYEKKGVSWCSTPNQLLICSSFNREDGPPLLICKSWAAPARYLSNLRSMGLKIWKLLVGYMSNLTESNQKGRFGYKGLPKVSQVYTPG